LFKETRAKASGNKAMTTMTKRTREQSEKEESRKQAIDDDAAVVDSPE